MSENYHKICEMICSFQEKTTDYHKRKNPDNSINKVNISASELWKTQICLLEKIILIEQANSETEKMLLEINSILDA